MGITSRRIAEHLSIDVSAYRRIELGESVPLRETARRMFDFFGGAVPLSVIYDPRHKTSIEWSKTIKSNAALVARGEVLRGKYPELGLRFLPRVDKRRKRKAG